MNKEPIIIIKPWLAAPLGGHRDIVERMLNLGANDYNRSMVVAAGGGHRDIVERMLNLGANDYNRPWPMRLEEVIEILLKGC